MIAVVIPCYKEKKRILSVVQSIPESVTRIIVVDDACPEGTGHYVKEKSVDPRVRVIRHDCNLGVGAAMVTGYREALKDSTVQVVVKMDGDGQMNPALIPRLVQPVLSGVADYSKGNRFFELGSLKGMPLRRLLGNTILSFLSKFSTGYWNMMDPTNGFTAIHTKCLKILPLDKLSQGYFFETDMLFRLYTFRAKLEEIPMQSRYLGEKSSMSLLAVTISFPFFNLNRFFKRIFYSYFLRDFNAFSLLSVCGVLLILFGGIFGVYEWTRSSLEGILRSSGTVMLAGLPIITGFQFLLGALVLDVLNVPSKSIHPLLD